MNESPIFDTENWTFRQVGEGRKMGLDIGRLLYGIRTKYQISVNDICRGICGVQPIACMKMMK